MYKLLRHSFIILVFSLTLFTTYSGVTGADENAKKLIASSYRQSSDVCNTVAQLVQKDTDTREVVKTGIQLGHSTCIVVKCALHAGGKLEDVITGALEAGARTDVLSRCALEAGADPQEVAGAIFAASQMLACAEPEDLSEAIDALPSEHDKQGGGPVSPYTF